MRQIHALEDLADQGDRKVSLINHVAVRALISSQVPSWDTVFCRSFSSCSLFQPMHLLAAKDSAFLILTVHLTGRIADGLAALTGGIAS